MTQLDIRPKQRQLFTKLGFCFCIFTLFSAVAVTSSAQQATVPASTGYVVVRRDADSDVLQQTNFESSPTNGSVAQARFVAMIAAGRNFWAGTNWAPSDPTLQVSADEQYVYANKVQTKVQLSANLAASNSVIITSPDGIVVGTTPVAIALYDPVSGDSLIIASITNCAGTLIGDNQVLYENCFNGVSGDILYTLQRGSFSQDIVFEQNIDPTAYGFSTNSQIQILSAFNAPTPQSVARPLYVETNQTIRARMASPDFMDHTLKFGQLEFGPGRAASTASKSQFGGAPIAKDYETISSQPYLVESIEYRDIRNDLQALPQPAVSATVTMKNHGRNRKGAANLSRIAVAKGLKNLFIPAPHSTIKATFAVKSHQNMVAEALKPKGVIADYIALPATEPDPMVFQGDTTYFVDGPADFNDVVFEGGSVIKYANVTNASIEVDGNLTCDTQPYLPTIFTAADDDSVGQSMSGIWTGYTGTIQPGGYANPALYLTGDAPALSNLRISDACTGVYSDNDITVTNLQVINCGYGFYLDNEVNTMFENVLVANANCAFGGYSASSATAENVTVANCEFLTGDDAALGLVFVFSNSILANVTNAVSSGIDFISGNNNGLYNFNPGYTPWGFSAITATNWPFESVGGGNYYLADGTFRGQGTTNIDPALLADLEQKTTWPPATLFDTTISGTTNFIPQVPRDNSGTSVDLGWHYAPIDLAANNVTLATNASVTLSPGTALGWFGTGFHLYDGAQFNSMGTASDPCRVFYFSSVQEGIGSWEGDGTNASLAFNLGGNSTNYPQISSKFTKWYGCALMDELDSINDYGIGGFADCEFYNVYFHDIQPSANFTNCLFFRDYTFIEGPGGLNLINSTFFGGLFFYLRSSGTPAWSIMNCPFDGTAFKASDGHTNNIVDYNAYNTNNLGWQSYAGAAGTLLNIGTSGPYVGPHDVTVSNYNWQSSFFGNFYLPATSQLRQHGSTNANLLGLYWFTTQSTQSIESNNIVDMGYAYVATDTNGDPLANYIPQIPNYVLSPNGPPTNLLVIISQPTNQTVMQGSNVTLSVVVEAIPSASYQWFFNSNSLSGATAAGLEFSDVQTNDAGAYFVVVSNNFGAVTSSVANLTVVAPPTIAITSPPNNSIFIAQQTNLALMATASDFDGSVTQVQFFQGATNLGAVDSTPYDLVWSNAPAGNYALTAVGSDNGGNTFTSSVIYLTVSPPTVTAVGGAHQVGLTNSWLPMPLTVQLIDMDGFLLTNASVAFTLTEGAGLIAVSSNGIAQTMLETTTGTNGWASVWMQMPATAGVSVVTATVQEATNLLKVSFDETAVTSGEASMVSIGGERIMELTHNGDVISWGGNQFGELGDYTHLDDAVPAHVVGLTNIVAVACGLNHSLAIDPAGTLWAWGDNEYGQLGNGTWNSTNVPVIVCGMTNCVMAAVGYNHSVALLENGAVWTWGDNGSGELGNGGSSGTNLPIQVQLPNSATAISAGFQHTLALLADGSVWAWGDQPTPTSVPTQVTDLSHIVAISAGGNSSQPLDLALDDLGNVWTWGFAVGANNSTPVMVNGIANVTEIAAGASHCLAVDNTGKLWAWGNDGAGQLGDGGAAIQTNTPIQVEHLTNIVLIAAGSDASVASDVNGNLWQFGICDSDNTNWSWGNEDGPTPSPSYVDFYEGRLPNLAILSGDDQTAHAGKEFAQSLVFRVASAAGTALSNAPVSVEVVAGDTKLETASDGLKYKGLRLTTDVNGDVSLIGYADRNICHTNCLIRVLAASRQQYAEADFTESAIPSPTVSITSPGNGSITVIETNQPLVITANAQAAPGAAITQVDYTYQTNTPVVPLATVTQNPYTFDWTNSSWWTTGFVQNVTISGVAVDNGGSTSCVSSVTTTVAMDSDGSGLPDYWQLEYFGHLGMNPNSSPDGNGQSLLYDFTNGIDPTDFYDGNYVSVDFIDGTNQIATVPSFLSQPLTVSVTDAFGFPWTNAPIVFDVTNGSALIATSTNAIPSASLSLWTDSNGEASVWVHFPATSPSNSTSAIIAGTPNGAYTATAYEFPILGHWRFDNTNTWIGDEGQLPLTSTNVVGIPSWDTNAVVIDATNPVILAYNVVETNGNTNIDFQTGTVCFWFKPDWGQNDINGNTGPGCYGRLLEAGNYSPAFTNGWWALFVSPDGSQLTFGSSTNGAATINLSTEIYWQSRQWHQIALTYSSNCAALYIDGQEQAIDTVDTNYYPALTQFTNGFRVGSDTWGGRQARGTFEDLETFSYQLSPSDIANLYTSAPLSAPPTVLITDPTSSSLNLVDTNYSLPIAVNAQAAPGFSVQEVAYSYGSAGGDPPIGTSAQNPFSIIWTNSDWSNYLGDNGLGSFGYAIQAIAVDSGGVASAPSAETVTIELDSYNVGIPDFWQFEYFGTNGLDPNSSPDGNGQTLLYDYQNNINPADYYDGILPNLNITGGNFQSGTNYLFLPTPLAVTVTGTSGLPLTNAPVEFAVTNGDAMVSDSMNDLPETNLVVRTDTNGVASVWCYFPPGVTNVGSAIAAQAWSSGSSVQVSFGEGLAGMSVISGNDQGGVYNSFLPQPIIIQETDLNGLLLTNAPVLIAVTNGTVLLAASTNDPPASALDLCTDTNGEVRAWAYFPAASSTPPDSTIVVSASSGTNPVSCTVNEYILLGHWTFNNTNTWVGQEGQLPLTASNVFGIPDWSSNSVVIDSTNPAFMTYNVVEANGTTNLDCQTGSVVFYFMPEWNSVNYDGNGDGTGPGTSGRLIEIGSYNPAFTNGWWSLYFSPDGNEILFATSTNGDGMTNFIANISDFTLTSNTWYQVALTYSATNSALFVNGEMVTNGAGVIYYPNSDELKNGFRIGSDQGGSEQAGGAFDELETFDQPLIGAPTPSEDYWFGIPDYQDDSNGALGPWQITNFGFIGLDPNLSDGNGTNTLLYDYQYGIDPNVIAFSVSFTNNYVTTSIVTGALTVLSGIPSNIAVLVDNTNFASASWMPYTSPTVTVNLGSVSGMHTVWIGMDGPSTNVQQDWTGMTLILDTNAPSISIASPANGASFNSSRVDVSGSFSTASVQQITVNGVGAFVNGTNFEALNVPLSAGTNIITADVVDYTGVTNAASVFINGLTNADGSMNDPVDLETTPVAGFSPLSVSFTVQANAPGSIQQVSYDFVGSGFADFVTNNLGPFNYTYATNGQYLPVATVQTTVGEFSSAGGWNNLGMPDSNAPVINVQGMPSPTLFANMSDPVALRWNGTNLYALSGSAATLVEFDLNGNPVRSLSGLGINPSGFDLDTNGNVYVALSSSNQIWKLDPSGASFTPDPAFGHAGFIGLPRGLSGTNTTQFNSPYAVAVSSDGSQIAVSDSGNNRIQFFDTSGNFTNSLGSFGSALGQFNNPRGITYDAAGNLYIADSGNDRIVVADDYEVLGLTGTNGEGFEQFNNPANIGTGERGVFIADLGNNRIQCLNPLANAVYSFAMSDMRFVLSSNLDSPAAVAVADGATNELLFVADTGHNRIVSYEITAEDPTPIWKNMMIHATNGDLNGLLANFSVASADGYRDALLSVGVTNAESAIAQIGTLIPLQILNDSAEFMFTNTVDGQVVSFPVYFNKENGVWRISSF